MTEQLKALYGVGYEVLEEMLPIRVGGMGRCECGVSTTKLPEFKTGEHEKVVACMECGRMSPPFILR
ncbi:MAG: hypothetical protein WCK11_00990 [Candidatus Falkowbacteria bacterium]